MLTIKQSAAIRNIAEAKGAEEAFKIFIDSILYADALAADEKRGYDSRDAIRRQKEAKARKLEQASKDSENRDALAQVREYLTWERITEWATASDIMRTAGVDARGKRGMTYSVIQNLVNEGYLVGEKMGSRKRYRSARP